MTESNDKMSAPKLTEAQRIGRLVARRIINRGPNGQRPGPAWSELWDVQHEGGPCAGCSDGRHALAMSKAGARAWAKERGIVLLTAGEPSVLDYFGRGSAGRK